MSVNVKVEQRPRVLYYGPHHGGAEPPGGERAEDSDTRMPERREAARGYC